MAISQGLLTCDAYHGAILCHRKPAHWYWQGGIGLDRHMRSAGLASRSTSRDWSGLGSRTSTQGSGSFWAAVPNPEADDRALLEALVESPTAGSPGRHRPVALSAAGSASKHSSRRASSTRSAQPSGRRLGASRSSSIAQDVPPAQVCGT